MVHVKGTDSVLPRYTGADNMVILYEVHVVLNEMVKLVEQDIMKKKDTGLTTNSYVKVRDNKAFINVVNNSDDVQRCQHFSAVCKH